MLPVTGTPPLQAALLRAPARHWGSDSPGRRPWPPWISDPAPREARDKRHGPAGRLLQPHPHPQAGHLPEQIPGAEEASRLTGSPSHSQTPKLSTSEGWRGGPRQRAPFRRHGWTVDPSLRTPCGAAAPGPPFMFPVCSSPGIKA